MYPTQYPMNYAMQQTPGYGMYPHTCPMHQAQGTYPMYTGQTPYPYTPQAAFPMYAGQTPMYQGQVNPMMQGSTVTGMPARKK